jgi:hypothetical protein
VLSQREKIVVARHQILGLGDNRRGKDHVVVWIAHHPDRRHPCDNRGEARESKAILDNSPIGVDIAASDANAVEENPRGFLKDIVGEE